MITAHYPLTSHTHKQHFNAQLFLMKIVFLLFVIRFYGRPFNYNFKIHTYISDNKMAVMAACHFYLFKLGLSQASRSISHPFLGLEFPDCLCYTSTNHKVQKMLSQTCAVSCLRCLPFRFTSHKCLQHRFTSPSQHSSFFHHLHHHLPLNPYFHF